MIKGRQGTDRRTALLGAALAVAAAVPNRSTRAATGSDAPPTGQPISNVTPEQFGALGDGRHDDTAAWIAAAAVGAVITPRDGATYLLSRSISPPAGKPLLIIGRTCKAPAAATLVASPGFRGYLLQPSGNYEIKGIRMVGNGQFGCHLIGSDQASGSGGAVLENLDLRSADCFVNFGPAWEHPLGLVCRNIYGQHFLTGGLIFGGTSGGARSGESAWTFDHVIMTNNGTELVGATAAQSVQVAANRSATLDILTWRDSGPSPLFGWLALRSADGKTNWHTPPNWMDGLYRKTIFAAHKAPGETWTYAVVRQTVGVSLHRGKAVACGVIQAEYCGIGLLLTSIWGFSIQALYFEIRDHAPKTFPNCAALMISGGSYGSLSTGWFERASYGIVCDEKSQIKVGIVRANQLGWALFGSRKAAQSDHWEKDSIVTGTHPSFFRQLFDPYANVIS